ncbi:toxin co-regulated pilus biosynthesis Q family protein [Cupriavidus plantarum]|uniref:toxin co-regulated pilus biosynthesis Q family protein n=1 Tax=Cupriavidus plantarum TaxID=942865 RepID=UPI00339D4FF5
MYLPRSFSRMCRVLLCGGAAVALCAHAAVPGVSPFGADASGTFEPTKPLAGGGWQLLSDGRNAQPKSATLAAAPVAKAPATGTASASAGLPAAQPIPAAPVTAVVAAPVAVAPTATSTRDWSVSPADGNYRLLIEKWAREVGWTAAPWEPDQDVQIEGADAFTGDFKAAVRRALASTEMTDYSLKPCFYSNNLVRVVKLTTKCDPTK